MGEEMAYGARCRVCGYLCAATTDNLEHPERTAEHLAEFVREGLIIERVSSETIREEFHRCMCPSPPVPVSRRQERGS